MIDEEITLTSPLDEIKWEDASPYSIINLTIRNVDASWKTTTSKTNHIKRSKIGFKELVFFIF